MIKSLILGWSILLITTASAVPTSPGTYSSDGNTPGVPAPPGYYVSTSGATTPTPAPIGRYAAFGGQTSASQAPLGRYVPAKGMSEALLAPAGYYVNSSGASAATPASPGSYVSTSGASTSTLASPGTYVPCPAATTATFASAGHYVNSSGATAQTPAQPGYYISSVGSTSASAAPVGRYVPTSGASSALLAEPGHYVASSGATAQTPAPPGYFIHSSGTSSAIAAPIGRYVPTAGATSAIKAPPGTFVSTFGASAVTPAPPGYFVSISGASAASAAIPGTYVPTSGASAALLCPPGTTSYVASAACRVIQEDHPCGLYVVGPCPQTDAQEQMVGTNLTGQVVYQISIENKPQETSGELTRLTLVEAYFTGADTNFFSVDFTAPLTLEQGTSVILDFSATAPVGQSVHATLNLVTDQYASVGEPGNTQYVHMVCLQSTAAADSDNDGLLDTDEALLGTRDDWADTDGDGYDDGFEAANPQMDPLVDDADLVYFFQDERAMFDLYTATDIQEGSMGDLVLEPLGGGFYQFEWMLMSTTNLVEGIWDPISTNQLLFTPNGADETQLFRIRAGQ